MSDSEGDTRLSDKGDSYLWDKTGEPDPEIERLEMTLGSLRETAGLLEPRPRWSIRIPLAVAASIGILSLLAWQIQSATRTHWDVKAIAGRIEPTRLHAGESLETNGSSRARLDLATTGMLELEPNSRIQILPQRGISLLHGTLRATIWAPEGEFSVAAPSATAIDLGCIYTVETDARGSGFVRVEAGWVALEDKGQESFIPGGEVCRMVPKHGPGVPYIETSGEPLKQLVAEFDLVGSTALLTPGLASAVRSDDVTLWHLLRRVPLAERGIVFDRLKSLAPALASIKRADAVSADPGTIDAIWKALGYGDADWWRKWKAHQKVS